MNDRIFMHFPIEIEKGEDGKYKRVIIKGKASTPHQDKQGEWIDPMGCDIDDFKRISDDHIKGNMGTIGEIKKAHKDHEAVWIDEAELYPELKQVQHIVDLADAIKKRPDSKMQLSFSIEGSALERDSINPKRILKAKLTGAAVTLQPINQNATAELFAKSLNYDDSDFDALEKGETVDEKRYLYEWKDANGVEYKLTKSFEIEKRIFERGDFDKYKKEEKSTTAELADDDSEDVLKKEELKKKTVSLIAKAIEEKRISKEKGKKMLKHFLNQ